MLSLRPRRLRRRRHSLRPIDDVDGPMRDHPGRRHRNDCCEQIVGEIAEPAPIVLGQAAELATEIKKKNFFFSVIVRLTITL